MDGSSYLVVRHEKAQSEQSASLQVQFSLLYAEIGGIVGSEGDAKTAEFTGCVTEDGEPLIILPLETA